MDDAEIPLGESALIMEGEIRSYFDTETDPGGIPWIDLNEDWAERKKTDPRFTERGLSPSGDYILRLTGNLYDAATDPGAFVITGDTVMYDPSGLPEYGLYHQTSTSRMPARPFIGISEESVGEIEATFVEWVNVGIDEVFQHTGTIYQHPTGAVQGRIPKGMPGAGQFAKKIG